MPTDALALLMNNLVDAATLSGGSWNSSYPLVNIKDKDIQRTARSTNVLAASSQFVLDSGSNSTIWSFFALIGHNISPTGTWRVVISNSNTASPAIWDSGNVSPYAAISGYASVPWTSFGWPSTHTGAYMDGKRESWMFHPTQVTGRYCFIYITDTSNPGTYIEIGRAAAGLAWQPLINMDFGFSLQWVDPTEVARTRASRRVSFEMPPYRVAKLTMSWLSKSELYSFMDELQRKGKRSEIFFIGAPNDPIDARFRNSFWGALAETSEMVVNQYLLYRSSLTIEEIV